MSLFILPAIQERKLCPGESYFSTSSKVEQKEETNIEELSVEYANEYDGDDYDPEYNEDEEELSEEELIDEF